MTTHKEALKLALEALSPWSGENANHTEQYAAYHAIDKALAQQEGQSNYCLQCEALSLELAALKAQQSNEQVEPVKFPRNVQKYAEDWIIDPAFLTRVKHSIDHETPWDFTPTMEQVEVTLLALEVIPSALFAHLPVPTAQPEQEYKRGYADAMNWKVQNHLEHLPPSAYSNTHQPEQEPVAWRNAAIRVGEDLCSVGPFGYYDMTAEQWLDWALSVVTVHAPPPQRTWVGLEPHEIAELVDEVDWYNFPMDLVRATEAKLKEKNT